MTTQYATGVAFERKIIADLEARGYFCVRAAGSHGKADIVAISDGGARPMLVQAKSGSRIDAEEWNELFFTARDHDCSPILATLDKSERRHRIVYSIIEESLTPHKRRATCMMEFEP